MRMACPTAPIVEPSNTPADVVNNAKFCTCAANTAPVPVASVTTILIVSDVYAGDGIVKPVMTPPVNVTEPLTGGTLGLVGSKMVTAGAV